MTGKTNILVHFSFLAASVLSGSLVGAFANEPLPQLQACGETGSVSDRMRDCFESNGSLARKSAQGGIWKLVSSTPSGMQVWKEPSMRPIPGALWGDRLDETMSQQDADDVCPETYALDVSGFNSNVEWKKPTKADIERTIRRGAREVLPNFVVTTRASPTSDEELDDSLNVGRCIGKYSYSD